MVGPRFLHLDLMCPRRQDNCQRDEKPSRSAGIEFPSLKYRVPENGVENVTSLDLTTTQDTKENAGSRASVSPIRVADMTHEETAHSIPAPPRKIPTRNLPPRKIPTRKPPPEIPTRTTLPTIPEEPTMSAPDASGASSVPATAAIHLPEEDTESSPGIPAPPPFPAPTIFPPPAPKQWDLYVDPPGGRKWWWCDATQEAVWDD